MSSSFLQEISFGFKLQRAAHVHNVSSICCINETGTVFFSILKLLIRLIAHSTWIRRLATSLFFLTSAEGIWLFIWARGETSRLHKWRSSSSLIWKPLPLLDRLLSKDRKNHSLVIYLSEALPPQQFDNNVINPFGLILAKDLMVLWCL